MRALHDALELLGRYGEGLALERVLADSEHRAVVLLRDDLGTLLVAKLDEDPERLEVEAGVLDACQGILPVPGVRWRCSAGPGILLLEHLPGVPLAGIDVPEAWQAAGRVLRILHAVEVPAALRERGDASRIERWVDRQRAAAERSSPPLPAGLSALLREPASGRGGAGGEVQGEVQEETQGEIQGENQGENQGEILLHGDAAADHYLVDTAGRSVVGVLDFGNVLVGDAALDLASLTLRAPQRLDDVIEGYGPSPELRRRLPAAVPFYRLVVLVSRFAFLAARGRDTGRVVQLIEAELAAPQRAPMTLGNAAAKAP